MTDITCNIANDEFTVYGNEYSIVSTEINQAAGFYAVSLFLDKDDLEKVELAKASEQDVDVLFNTFPTVQAKVIKVVSEDLLEGKVTRVHLRHSKTRILRKA